MIETMPAELAENLIDFCENRDRVYALLSRCYETEIDAAFAEALAGEAALASDDAGLAAGFAALQADLADCDEDALEQLAVVFDRAFFGMNAHRSEGLPYESVYTSEGGLMMQRLRGVLHVYRGAASRRTRLQGRRYHWWSWPSWRFCAGAPWSARAGDRRGPEAQLRAQREFLSDHLLNWIDRFTADVRKAAEDGFYFDLATFTEGFLTADAAELAEVLG
ncbi:MAG: molecular chaperone [Eggerthella lenta]